MGRNDSTIALICANAAGEIELSRTKFKRRVDSWKIIIGHEQ